MMAEAERKRKANREEGAGVCCPTCGCPETPVVYTRHHVLTVNEKRVGTTRRCRQCAHCGRRFMSSERVG